MHRRYRIVLPLKPIVVARASADSCLLICQSLIRLQAQTDRLNRRAQPTKNRRRFAKFTLPIIIDKPITQR
jgi:hypothetical protein